VRSLSAGSPEAVARLVLIVAAVLYRTDDSAAMLALTSPGSDPLQIN